MKILHLIASVDPEGGGPIEYARVMAEYQQSEGHYSCFLTLDKKSEEHLVKFPYEVHSVGTARGFLGDYLAFNSAIAKIANDYDVAVIHGLWNVATIAGYSALRDSGLPWVIFTHGMLDPYFREIKPFKHWVKQVFWSIFQGRMLSESSAVLFTCQEEYKLAQGSFWGYQKYNGQVVSFCASDLSIASSDNEIGEKEFLALIPDIGTNPYFLFLSRIHPKKACDNLIVAFSALPEEYRDFHLVLAGPDQSGWQKDLEELARSLRVEKRVHWPGMLTGEAKLAAFYGASAFVLPSHQENFGIVVAEALSAKLPALISYKVNIWSEILEDGAGKADSDTVEGTQNVLQEFLSLPTSEKEQMRYSARECYLRRFSVKSASKDLIKQLRAAADSKVRR